MMPLKASPGDSDNRPGDSERKVLMNHFEMAQTLREKTGISYEEARRALEQAGWDILEAMVALEKEGKLDHDNNTSKEGPMDSANTRNNQNNQSAAKNIENVFTRFFRWLVDLIARGNRNHFIITRNDRRVASVPVTAAVVLFLVFHGAFMFFLIVGLITGYRFSFESGQQAAARDKDVEEARRAADQLNDRHAVNSFDGNA